MKEPQRKQLNAQSKKDYSINPISQIDTMVGGVIIPITHIVLDLSLLYNLSFRPCYNGAPPY